MRHFLSAPGILCSLGNSREKVLSAALAGSREGLVRLPGLVLDSEPYFGRVSGELPPIEGTLKRYDCRNNRLLLAAFQQIEEEVAAAVERFGASRVGVVIGSSTSGILEVEEALIEQRDTGSFPPDYYDYKQEMGTVAEFLAGHAALQSVAITISTACSSSGKVFYSARNLIEAGICDAVVVGARREDVGGNTDQGSLYVFERNQGGMNNWGESAEEPRAGTEGSSRWSPSQ